LLPPVLLGIFMRALQMTVIAPSLLNIAHSLGATLADVGWVMAVYATGSLIAQPIAGRLSDARGRRLLFIASVAVFAFGSLVCALSTSLPWLIAGRVVQSLGAGGVQPAAIALIGQRVPPERQSGALYATYGMFALAGALGAVLGGALIDGAQALAAQPYLSAGLRNELGSFPWHLIFWINLPLALITVCLALRIPADQPNGKKAGVDAAAIALICAVALSLMMAASGAQRFAAAWIVLAMLCLAALSACERKAAHPLIDPALFKERGLSLVSVIAFLSGIPIFSVTMYAAAYYMAQFQATAANSGLALLALALPLGAGQGAGGRLTKRLGLKALLVAGLIALAAGEIVLALVPSRAGVLLAFALAGFGMGLASAPPNVLVLRYVAAERSGAATGFLTMMGSTGAITAPALVTAFLHYSGLTIPQSFRLEYFASFIVCTACVPLAGLLPQPSDENARLPAPLAPEAGGRISAR